MVILIFNKGLFRKNMVFSLGVRAPIGIATSERIIKRALKVISNGYYVRAFLILSLCLTISLRLNSIRL